MGIERIEPGIEIYGLNIYSGVAAFPMTRCVSTRLLLKKGLGKRINKKFKIDDTDWYQQQNWLDALKEMSLRFLGDVLSQIGMRMLEYAPFPETTKDLETAIKQMDIIYHKVHRKNGDYV
jgi:hypothetical protein